MADETTGPATTTTAGSLTVDQFDIRGPSPERQAELRSAYEDNVAVGNPPYEAVAIRTLGEIRWIMGERNWSGEHLMPDGMQRPDLRGAMLSRAHLSGAILCGANLSGADLNLAILRTALLSNADLSGADLSFALLRGAYLSNTNLSGADLYRADLSGARLSETRMDRATRLTAATLDSKTRLGYINWQGVSLGRIERWPRRLGDEHAISEAKTRQERIKAYRDAARAYRTLSTALHSQGIIVPSSTYRLREQVLEREAAFQELNIIGWIFSWLLFLVAGYGERPVRSFFAYLLIIFSFAGAYLAAGRAAASGTSTHHALSSPLAALILSVTSFHGRGFFPSMLALDDPVVVLAALEAVIGLFIEIIFIATLTQRFYRSR